jgi:hypothetical protein
LNPRERFAVEEWIDSGKAVHTIRDHPNHDRPINGGMWGGVKNAIPGGMERLIKKWSRRDAYGADLHFLTRAVWPLIKSNQIAHDAYSCSKYPNSHPFPTQRPANFQHVGQVFFQDDSPRMSDIDCCMRGREAPMQCRKDKSWVYG